MSPFWLPRSSSEVQIFQTLGIRFLLSLNHPISGVPSLPEAQTEYFAAKPVQETTPDLI